MQKNFSVDKLNLKYVPRDGYTLTPFNKDIKLRTKLYNSSKKLYGFLQYLYSKYGNMKESLYVFNSRYLLRKHKHLINLTNDEKKHIFNLKENGYTVLENFISDDLADKIVNKMEENFKIKNICKGGYISDKFPSLNGLSISELDEIGERISVKNPFISIPEFLNIALDESILKIVSNYLGYIPASAYSIDRSHVIDKFIESSGWHKDTYTGDVVQVFIYLHDVDVYRGPLHFIPKTHKSNLKDFKVTYNFEKNINNNDGRISDEEIASVFNENEILKVNVTKCTAVIGHVNGFHKGPIWEKKDDPKNKYRDTLHMRFSSRPFISSLFGRNGRKPYNINTNQFNELSEFQKLFIADFNIV